MTTAVDTVMNKFVVQLAESGRADLVRWNAQKRDPRFLALTAAVEALAPAPVGHGFAGGLATFTTLGSSRHWRHMRAKSLLTARRLQLMGDHRSAWFWVHKAGEQRRSEMIWKAKERSPFHALLMGAAEYHAQAAE